MVAILGGTARLATLGKLVVKEPRAGVAHSAGVDTFVRRGERVTREPNHPTTRVLPSQLSHSDLQQRCQ